MRNDDDPRSRRHAEELVRINLRTVRGLPGLARRGPHTKHHGCVSAKFRVLKDIPSEYRQGLFAHERDFDALIRFSNGFQGDDRRGDVHGMAIKLLDVDGEKVLEWPTQVEAPADARAHDFVLMDNETFPTGNPGVYAAVNRLQRGQGRLTWLVSFLRLFLFHRQVMKDVEFTKSKKPASPLAIRYFSTTPYAFGPHRVKYVVEPEVFPDSGGSGVDSVDGLADALAETLSRRAVAFKFGIDIQGDEDRHPIEDPRICWSEAGARRVWLARIVIARQEVDRYSPLAENLSFSPWHALKVHEPLGYINKARSPVYREMARFRHRRNRIVPVASWGAPPEYRRMPAPVWDKLYWDPPPERPGLLASFGRRIENLLVKVAERWPALVRLVERIPPLRRFINRRVINRIACKTVQRPLPLSLWTPGGKPVDPDSKPTHGTFVSWPGLVERSFTGRHLPPIDGAEAAALPDIDRVAALFARRPPGWKPSPDTSALLCFFAQWLSDSFLRTHPADARRNTSTHELDLCQVYGLGQESTKELRDKRGGGRLKSRITACGELPPLLADPRTLMVKKEFKEICFDPILASSFDRDDPPRLQVGDLRVRLGKSVPWAVTPDRWRCHYAGGLDRASSTLLYSAFNTLFLREHNRLATRLRQWYGTDNDDWLFETARNINIVKYLKVLIEDYLNHIGGELFKITVEQGFADRCLWYRANRISIEFNLLYRWHSLVPNYFWIWNDRGKPKYLPHKKFRFNNAIIERDGIEMIIDAASRQPAGLVGLHNTPYFLLEAERRSIHFSRQFRLAPFNAYRRRWKLQPYSTFLEMTGGDERLADELATLYPDRKGVRGVDRVEFTVGLYAETRAKNAVLPTLLSLMVASDAFSHALTNPLLAAYVFGQGALTDFGMMELERVGALADIVRDNVAPGMKRPLASFGLPKRAPPSPWSGAQLSGMANR